MILRSTASGLLLLEILISNIPEQLSALNVASGVVGVAEFLPQLARTVPC